MNKLKLLFVCMLLCMAFTVKGQDCHSLVSPHFSEEIYRILPQEKLEYYCFYAQSAFYKTDALPDSAIVYNISDVVCNETNQPLPQNVVIDLNTFSVYAYNFYDFQHRHWGKEIYFETADSDNKYLVLRSVVAIYDKVDELVSEKMNSINKNKR